MPSGPTILNRFNLLLFLSTVILSNSFLLSPPPSHSNSHYRSRKHTPKSTSLPALTSTDLTYLLRSSNLALLSPPAQAFPNPSVGCVITSSEDGVIGTGFHPGKGWPHAEVFALAEVKTMFGAGVSGKEAALEVCKTLSSSKKSDSESIKSSPLLAKCTNLLESYKSNGAIIFKPSSALKEKITAYVTLEPCSHTSPQKTTPPCLLSLIAAGVNRVVIGLRDPNPEIHDDDFESLRGRGVDVDVFDGSEIADTDDGKIVLKTLNSLTANFRERMRRVKMFESGDIKATDGKERMSLKARINKGDGSVPVIDLGFVLVKKKRTNEDVHGERDITVPPTFLHHLTSSLFKHSLVSLNIPAKVSLATGLSLKDLSKVVVEGCGGEAIVEAVGWKGRKVLMFSRKV